MVTLPYLFFMSKTQKNLEWLVLIYDNAVNQRLAFRAQHLAKVPANISSGVVTSCGPIFKDETKKEFLGSSFTVVAETRSQVIDFLKKDIYLTEKVWDFDNIVIHPYMPVYREGKEFK